MDKTCWTKPSSFNHDLVTSSMGFVKTQFKGEDAVWGRYSIRKKVKPGCKTVNFQVGRKAFDGYPHSYGLSTCKERTIGAPVQRIFLSIEPKSTIWRHANSFAPWRLSAAKADAKQQKHWTLCL